MHHQFTSNYLLFINWLIWICFYYQGTKDIAEISVNLTLCGSDTSAKMFFVEQFFRHFEYPLLLN